MRQYVAGKMVGWTLRRQLKKKLSHCWKHTSQAENCTRTSNIMPQQSCVQFNMPPELFTPTFSAARMVGWTAHAIEQLSDNTIFRPQSVYVGNKSLN